MRQSSRSGSNDAVVDEALNLRVGEIVEVRSADEILATLDQRGMLDALPFMPEMLQFCGKRFRVYRRAQKTCDTIDWGLLRSMKNTTHLEGLRCDGSSHGGCQAGCLLFWKDEWLKRADSASPVSDAGASTPTRKAQGCSLSALSRATHRESDSNAVIYSCQATELKSATTPLPWWNPQQYLRDVRSGNAALTNVIRGIVIGFFNKVQAVNVRLLPSLKLIRSGKKYPFIDGLGEEAIVDAELDLQPGELIEVKSKREIFATLDARDRTLGLRFDGEMLRYCGRRGHVLRRVERIIDEKTGRMIGINSDCIIIDGFVCMGAYHRSCPRAIYPYWRESWLRRVDQP